MPANSELFLSLEELCRVVADKKEDFQRQANQAIRKDDLKQGWGALASIEALDQLLYACRLRAGEFSPVTFEERKEKRGIKPRASRVVLELKRKAGAV